ncbi:hypothetical protein QFZ87_002553 [Bacillus sp. SLBN-46]|uniref:CBO0543 family protein n=1 Tax=Bacillus sp. SLBN-46 TaxID=3042283 RepID=UPI0028654B17|nr:CBO0543 family protein [Bacillus sp. SLBN-46]MDR6122956.1 hypothetical protein [Bacillus sp. SLBN-46]
MLLMCIFTLLLFLLAIIWKRNNLTLLEILSIFLLVSTINQNVLDILTGNMKVMKITEQIQMFWASFMNRSFFIPLLCILFIDYLSTAKSTFQKISLFIMWTFLITGVEYLSKWIGVIQFVKWSIWYSVIEWGCILFLAVCCRKFLFYLYTKGTH